MEAELERIGQRSDWDEHDLVGSEPLTQLGYNDLEMGPASSYRDGPTGRAQQAFQDFADAHELNMLHVTVKPSSGYASWQEGAESNEVDTECFCQISLSERVIEEALRADAQRDALDGLFREQAMEADLLAYPTNYDWEDDFFCTFSTLQARSRKVCRGLSITTLYVQ